MTTHAKRLENDEPPYGRYAFLNPYNLSLFAGGVALGALAGHLWLVVVTCAAEAMWMIFAPDSKVLRAVWFDRAFARQRELDKRDRREEMLSRLAPQDRARLVTLANQKVMIESLARDNPSLGVELLGEELAKLDALLDDFAELATAASRAEQHAQTFDFAAMRRSWHVYEHALGQYRVGDARRDVAEKNLEVLKRRRARYDELGRTIQVTRGQMELIEQSFRLLADEIMTMASPNELGGRIDELRVAVDAVRETTGDTWNEELETELEVGHEEHR
jgi:hypothetical protein